jgi:DNA-binding PadR family transcriptional regulator
VQPDLGPGEWAVLGVVAEGPTHGFAVAQLLAPDGELGRIWTLPRPVVYQVMKKLAQQGLIGERRTEPGARGPVRTVVGVTPSGRAAVRGWLQEPVDHVRDVRSLLLLKLALLDRARVDAAPLLGAQKQRVELQLEALTRARDEADGFDRVIVEWRIASSLATLNFLRVVAS